jgi:hypothetical protein
MEFELIEPGNPPTLWCDLIVCAVLVPDSMTSVYSVPCARKSTHMEFELIEPINTLFKDEVRKLGIELGIPEHLVWRITWRKIASDSLTISSLSSVISPSTRIPRPGPGNGIN